MFITRNWHVRVWHVYTSIYKQGGVLAIPVIGCEQKVVLILFLIVLSGLESIIQQ